MADETNTLIEKAEDVIEVPESLGVLPLQDIVLYPGMVAPLAVTGDSSIALVDKTVQGDRLLAAVLRKKEDEDPPNLQDLHTTGCAAKIIKMLKLPDGGVNILIQGFARVRMMATVRAEPYLKAAVLKVDDLSVDSVEEKALAQTAIDQFQKMLQLSSSLPTEVEIALVNIDDHGRIADFIATHLNIEAEERQRILETIDVRERLQKVNMMIAQQLQVLEVQKEIQKQVSSEMGQVQKEAILRQQLKAIQEQLGEGDPHTLEIKELRGRIEKASFPEETAKAADYELDRLSRMPPSAAEYNVSRTYLDWILDLPWNASTEDRLDIKKAREVLDNDHYDLDKVKDRILEYLAVRQLKKDTKGPILCFVGPPGVGKTSLGQSIARALGRKFVRMSLGGVRDEAEIRGHRRTYVGALPGRIVQGMKKAGYNNPVFMLDEVDKLGADFRGDPSAALLEVLDPEQNHAFSDHYLEVPFDLSQVMFITTANMMEPVPPALRDRMEVLELSGYIEDEKIGIAKKYLIPRQLEAHGLTSRDVKFNQASLKAIIKSYTREAGLRNLEREIAAVCRKIARQFAEGKKDPVQVTPERIREFLGLEKFYSEVAERTQEPGVATGLAWTPNGGEILFIESTRMPGRQNLTLTGSLGEIMKESAQAAYSLIRSHADDLKIKHDIFANSDIHIHVPAGATPKDGPSAGIAIVTSLASLFTGRPVRSDMAMTGEITLRGKVLPVGGIKEKVIAAERAGIKTVLLPEKNERDLADVPPKVKKKLKFEFAGHIEDVFRLALSRAPGNDKK